MEGYASEHAPHFNHTEESRRIVFTPDAALPASTVPEFRIYDLYTCQSAD